MKTVMLGSSVGESKMVAELMGKKSVVLMKQEEPTTKEVSCMRGSGCEKTWEMAQNTARAALWKALSSTVKVLR